MTTVRLIDGSEVDCASEAWRFECEARAVLNMPNKDARKCYLYGWTEHGQRNERPINHKGVEQRRGKAEADRLHAKVMELWRVRQKLSA